MKQLRFISATLMAIAYIFVMNACKKNSDITVGADKAHFTFRESGSFQMTATNSSYKIPIGVSNVSDKDRTINIDITSPTGAQQGTHYNISSKSFVIPAGKSIDSITINGVFAQYQAGRKDTLIFTIREGGGLAPLQTNNRFVLAMRGPCAQIEVATSLQALLGNYNNTRETWGTSPYGPYRTTVKSATLTSATTANIVVGNIFDDGWSDLTFTLNWTDINNSIVTLAQQNAGGNAGNVFGATFNGQNYAVRPVPTAAGGQVGTFDFCNQRITLRMQVGVWNQAYSSDLYTVVMAR